MNWTHHSKAGIDDGVAIVGPSGKQIVAYGDYDGIFHVLSLSDGSQLYQYQTGGYVVSAFAEDHGNLVDTSSDGFVYDLTPGGGNTPAPATAVTVPADLSTIANPNGNVTVSGTATAGSGGSIGQVRVAVQRGGVSGSWWDSATGTWTATPYGNRATVADPGTASTSWTLLVPVPPAGGTYEAFASAVDTSHVADISASQSASTAARSSFTVMPTTTAPSIALSSPWVAPGGLVTVSGRGFQPGEQVAVSFNASTLATVTATSNGDLTASSVQLPKTTPFGPASLDATGTSSGLATSTPIYLTNADPQFRYTANRMGSEPDDTVLHNHLAVNENSFLTQAWGFTSTAPIRSSPTVVQAVAYFGNANGDFYAVDIRTGIERWVTAVPGAGSIDSSAAVDTSVDGGIAVFGTSTGSVVALHLADGSVAWRRSFGAPSIESSPTIVGGAVYIGAHSGVVYALNEVDGTIIWKAPLGADVQSSPAVDPAAKLVVVGDNGGAITALSSVTGAVVWTVTTGGGGDGNPARVVRRRLRRLRRRQHVRPGGDRRGARVDRRAGWSHHRRGKPRGADPECRRRHRRGRVARPLDGCRVLREAIECSGRRCDQHGWLRDGGGLRRDACRRKGPGYGQLVNQARVHHGLGTDDLERRGLRDRRGRRAALLHRSG